MNTDLQLQLTLARELPELLSVVEINALYYGVSPSIFWRDTKVEVTPREWNWIVRECERKLTVDEKTDYIRLVNAGDFSHRRLAFANWQTRAIAYFKTINKPIE